MYHEMVLYVLEMGLIFKRVVPWIVRKELMS